jgi:hypothetical protein
VSQQIGRIQPAANAVPFQFAFVIEAKLEFPAPPSMAHDPGIVLGLVEAES